MDRSGERKKEEELDQQKSTRDVKETKKKVGLWSYDEPETEYKTK